VAPGARADARQAGRARGHQSVVRARPAVLDTHRQHQHLGRQAPDRGRLCRTSVTLAHCRPRSLTHSRLQQDGAPGSCLAIVDVRDVARAHVEAMLRPEAAGHRFIVASSEGYTYVELSDMLRANGFGHLPLPTKLAAPYPYRMRFANAKAREILGIELRPVSDTIVDMVRYLIDNRIATPPTTSQ